MTDPAIHSVTKLLADWKGGDAAALEQLTPLVYRELRRLADSYLRREPADHTVLVDRHQAASSSGFDSRAVCRSQFGALSRILK